MRSLLKWTGIVLGALVIVVVLAGGVMYVLGGAKLNQTFEVPETALAVPTDSASIARGGHIVATSGCTGCHGEGLGGAVMMDEAPFRFVASNLTAGAGGVGATYTAADFERAIRHGVRPDGSFLMIMPSKGLHALSDGDAASLIAYLRQLPPVDNDLPRTEFRALGRIMAAAFPNEDLFLEVNTAPSPASAPAPGPTAEYGAYLAAGLCAYCHGDAFQGNDKPPGPPGMLPAPSLAAAGQWTRAEFAHTLQTGTTPAGRALNDEFMPIAITRNYTDDDLTALHAYLRTIGLSTPS